MRQTFNPSKCNEVRGCPVWFKSESSLLPTLSIIGNISKSTAILMLNGENDSATPVQQAFLLQQRLTEVNHPDHTLITYPNLGHVFYPSSQWSTGSGPIQQYVLANLYSWLESHSGFTNHAVLPPRASLLLLCHPLILLLNRNNTENNACAFSLLVIFDFAKYHSRSSQYCIFQDLLYLVCFSIYSDRR